MTLHNPSAARHATNYIRLNTRLCEACWECIEACPRGVIGRINLPFHKHAHIKQADRCQGCAKCVKACRQKAITFIRPQFKPEEATL